MQALGSLPDIATYPVDRLTHSCPIVEMDNESYRLQHSTLAAQRKIKSCERKRKDKEGIEDDEPFELHRRHRSAGLHAVGPDESSAKTLLLRSSTIIGTTISNRPWVNFQVAGGGIQWIPETKKAAQGRYFRGFQALSGP